MEDPHRSLTGAMASLWRKYTIIKLLGAEHHLSNFDLAAFPSIESHEDPSNPFLKDSSHIPTVIKVII